MTGRQSVLCAVERMLWRGVFVALAAVFLTVLLPVLWDLLSPFLIGLAVAALLRPLIALTQEKTHMRRGLAVGLWVALAVLAAMWLAYWICSFVVVQLAVATPGVVTGVVDMLRVASERLLDMAQALPSTIGDTLRTSLNGAFQSLSEAGMQFAGSVVNGALSVVASLPYAFVYANFLLLAVIFITNRYEKWRKFLAGRRLFGGERSIRLLRQSAGEGLAGYIRVQLLFSLLALLISWVFFQAVGFEYAFLIGFAAALLADSYVISYNGGFINRYGDPEPLLATTGDRASIERLYAWGVEHRQALHLYTTSGETYVPFLPPEEQEYLKGFPGCIELDDSVSSLDDFIGDDEPMKILFMDVDFKRCHRIGEELAPTLDPGNVAITYSSNRYVEFVPAGVNKGTALAEVQKQWHISAAETMAFGDYLNDVDLMTHAYYSYAMKNAHPGLKAVCRFETKDTNEQDGVVNTIAELLGITGI